MIGDDGFLQLLCNKCFCVLLHTVMTRHRRSCWSKTAVNRQQSNRRLKACSGISTRMLAGVILDSVQHIPQVLHQNLPVGLSSGSWTVGPDHRSMSLWDSDPLTPTVLSVRWSDPVLSPSQFAPCQTHFTNFLLLLTNHLFSPLWSSCSAWLV